MSISIAEFFTIYGKILKCANYYDSTFPTIVSNREALVQELADVDADHLVDGLASAVSGHISGLSAGCSFFQSKANDLLLDPSFTDQFALNQVNPTNVLSAIAAASPDAVEASPIVVGSITDAVGGDLLHSTYLDQVSIPVTGGLQLRYDQTNFVASELGVPGNVYVRCTNADVEGQEQFLIFGNSAIPPFQEADEAIGGSVSIQCGDLQNKITSNAGFETYSGGFTGWTINDAGGTLVQETSLVYRGTSAARINTLANADTIELEKTLDVVLERGKGYFVGIRYKSVAVESANNGAWTFYLGDGTLTANSLSTNGTLGNTNWNLVYAFVVYPINADPAENTIVKFTMSPTADGVDGIILDDAFVIPATYFNGVAWGHLNGQVRNRVNDLFTAPLTRPNVGILQEGFRKFWGVQMPSIDDTTETYPDTLAT